MATGCLFREREGGVVLAGCVAGDGAQIVPVVWRLRVPGCRPLDAGDCVGVLVMKSIEQRPPNLVFPYQRIVQDPAFIEHGCGSLEIADVYPAPRAVEQGISELWHCAQRAGDLDAAARKCLPARTVPKRFRDAGREVSQLKIRWLGGRPGGVTHPHPGPPPETRSGP